jgi:hypothetical protein
MNQTRVDWGKVYEGADGYARLIGLQIGNGCGIRGPPIGSVVTAEDFFPVNPGERAVQRSFRTVVGELGLLFGGQIPYVEVVGTDEGDEAPVGGELRILFLLRGLDQTGEGG